MFTENRIEFWKKVVASRQRDLVVVLEDIWDPHNAAAIFRTGDAFGIQNYHLIFETQKPFDPTRIGKRSSGKANKWLDFEVHHDAIQAYEKLKKDNYTLYVTEINEQATDLYQTDFLKNEKIALIIGNEHSGVSDTAKQYADHSIFIPMRGFVESFNVSVAASLCLSEISRQREASTTDYHLSKPAQATLLENFKQKQIAKRTYKLRKREGSKEARIRRRPL